MSGRSLGVVVAVVCLAHAAWAQEPSGEERAREQHRAAVQAFNAGDYEGAAAAFSEAYKIHPDPKIRLNLAIAYDKLANLDGAMVELEAFISERPDHPKVPAARARLGELGTLMSKQGKLVIHASPTPDKATIGGRTFKQFPVNVWLDPGRYTLTVEKAGIQPFSRELEIKRGERLEAQLTLDASNAVAASSSSPGAPGAGGSSSPVTAPGTPGSGGAAAPSTS
ncbi:MAG: tetratricopeptide repeat protein, partial [Myxococcota bacterium]